MRRSSATVATLVAATTLSCLGPDGVFDVTTTSASGGAGTTVASTSSTATTAVSVASSSTGSVVPGRGFDSLTARRYATPEEQFGKALWLGGSTIYVTGELLGQIDVDGTPLPSVGDTDVLLFATDTTFTGLWAKSFGDDGAQSGRAGAYSTTTSSLFVGGNFSGKLPAFDGGYDANDEDGFAARLDLQGVHQNHRFFEDAMVYAAAASNDGWVVGGDYDGFLDYAGNAGEKRDAYVIWINPTLGAVDGAAITSDEPDATTAVAVGPSGQVAAVGIVRGPASVRGTAMPHNGMGDAFVALFDEERQLTYAGSAGDGGTQFATDVVYDAAGNAVVVGNFQETMTFGNVTLTSLGGFDVFVAVLAPDGSVVAANSFGGPQDQTASSVVVRSSGEIVVAGTYLGAPDLGGQPLAEHEKSDVFLLALDPALNHLASAGYGDDETQRAVDLAIDTGDHLYLLADVQGTIDFGDGPLAPIDTSFDIVLAKLAP